MQHELGIINVQGCNGEWNPVPKKPPIDQMTGDLNVYDLCPERGDSILVVNCGTHFEIRYHRWNIDQPVALTDEDIEDLKHGRVTWH